MITPDGINPIKPNPRRDTDYASQSSDSNAERVPPNVRKDFKKILEEDADRKGQKPQVRRHERPDNKSGLRPMTKDKKQSKDISADSWYTGIDEDPTYGEEQVASSDEVAPFTTDTTTPKKTDTTDTARKRTTSGKIPLPDSGPGALAKGERKTPMSIYSQLTTDNDEEVEVEDLDFVSDNDEEVEDLDFVSEEVIKKEKQRPFALETMSQSDGDLPLPPAKEKSSFSRKEKSSSSPQDEKGISPFNLMANSSTVASISESKGTVKAEMPRSVKELMDLLVDRLYTVEQSGKTETVVEIKNIPLFEGAQVVVTEFESAAKEFNISFENLTQAAKQVLEQNMSSLRTHLEQAGFANAVHIVTTTTTIENRTFGTQTYTREDKEKGEGEQQQQRNRGQEQG